MEVGYVGRFGRDMLIRRDIAMPLNLIDPGVGHGLFHRRAGDDSRRAGGGHFGEFAGQRLRRPAAHGVLGEPRSRLRPAAA